MPEHPPCYMSIPWGAPECAGGVMDDGMTAALHGLLPKSDYSRRAFLMTSLATGFALSAQPIAAQTAIHTDSAGLEAGEVQIPVVGGHLPAYRAMPDSGGPFPIVLVCEEIF